jgi:hypothetical protein
VSWATADAARRRSPATDYQSASGVLTIPGLALSGTITVAVNGRPGARVNEQFLVNLSSEQRAIADDQGVNKNDGESDAGRGRPSR